MEKPYGYIPELQGAIIDAKLEDKGRARRSEGMADDDPRKIAKNMATLPKPDTSELVKIKEESNLLHFEYSIWKWLSDAIVKRNPAVTSADYCNNASEKKTHVAKS